MKIYCRNQETKLAHYIVNMLICRYNKA